MHDSCKRTKAFKIIANIIFAVIFIPVLLNGQPQELTLDECRELAIKNNQQVEIAQLHRLAATSVRKASYTKFFPGFDITGSYIRTNKKFNFLEEDMLMPVIPVSAINPQTGQVDPDRLFNPDLHPDGAGVIFKPGSSDYYTDPDGNPLFYRYTWLPQDQMSFGQNNNFLFNFGMTQPIYTGGKIRAQYRMTTQIESITEYGEELELSSVLYETEKLYWKVYTLQEMLTLAKEYHTLLENIVNDLSNLYEEGIVSQNDVLKARVRKNEANLSKIQARNGLELSKMALCRMIGLPITTEIEVSDTLWISEDLHPLDELFHKALANRPELKIASKNVEIGESVVKLAEARFLPDIALSANYFMVNPDPYQGFSNQFGRDWNVGIIMRIPVFHWNERRHVVNATKHEKKVQQLKLEDYRELVKLEVNKIFYELNEAREKINIATLSLEQAKENLNVAEDNFEVGRITTTELLEAQALWREAHSNHIEAKSNMRIQQTNMQKAIGKLIND